MKAGLALLLTVGLATVAHADCRRGGVEWIVGGSVQMDCDAKASPASHDATRLKVSTTQQRTRDDERLGILAQELAQEERRLPQATDADSALRIRDNIAALKREMSRVPSAPR